MTMELDHGTIVGVDSMSISQFKATCLAALERVRKTGRPLLVTKRGVPIAQVIPPVPVAPDSGFGVMQGTAKQTGDVVAPLPAKDWDALR